MTNDESPFTDAHRRAIQDRHRGRKVRKGWYRNFCANPDCGVPMEVKQEHRLITTLRCAECSGSTDGKAAAEMLGIQRLSAISLQRDGKGSIK